MTGWLKLVLTAAAVMVGLWALLVVLAARLPPGLLKDLAGFLPACVTLARRLLERLLGTPATQPAQPEGRGDEQGRT